MGTAVVALGARRACDVAVVLVARGVAKCASKVQPRLAAELARRRVDLGAGPAEGGDGGAHGGAVILALEGAAGGRGGSHGSEGGEDEAEGDHDGGGEWLELSC